MGIVVSTGLLSSLGHRQPSEFSTPDHQRLLEKAALLKICQEPGNRSVGLSGKLGMVPLDIGVSIPAPLVFVTPGVQLDEADSSFDQSAGNQTLPGKVIAALIPDAVQRLHVSRFVLDRQCLGCR